jgi:hypothetical protein
LVSSSSATAFWALADVSFYVEVLAPFFKEVFADEGRFELTKVAWVVAMFVVSAVLTFLFGISCVILSDGKVTRLLSESTEG